MEWPYAPRNPDLTAAAARGSGVWSCQVGFLGPWAHEAWPGAPQRPVLGPGRCEVRVRWPRTGGMERRRLRKAEVRVDVGGSQIVRAPPAAPRAWGHGFRKPSSNLGGSRREASAVGRGGHHLDGAKLGGRFGDCFQNWGTVWRWSACGEPPPLLESEYWEKNMHSASNWGLHTAPSCWVTPVSSAGAWTGAPPAHWSQLPSSQTWKAEVPQGTGVPGSSLGWKLGSWSRPPPQTIRK